jgi:hypothetical protein
MTNKFLLNIVWILIIGLSTSLVFGQPKTTKSPAPKEDKEKEKISLIGRWTSSEAKIEFFENGTITINGDKYKYAVAGKTIVVGNDEGQIEFPFTLKGDTLTVLVEGRKVIYTRSSKDDDSEAEVQPQTTTAGGSIRQELVGKWCYLANVQAQGGGRMSERCFTLSANGTYQYHSETSSSNPNGGSSSQENDSGRWSATATTITARSNSGQTITYSLEKRNHPKTGDPMLIVDGDAFVTFYQRQPW